MIRPATLADRQAITGLLERWFERYPLTPDYDRIQTGLREMISGAPHFAWVAEEAGEVKGVLLGLTSDNLWARKKNCNVLAWISEIPGAGIELLREFTEFVKSRAVIRVAGFAPDIDDIDPRVWTLVVRMGFKRHGGAYLMFR